MKRKLLVMILSVVITGSTLAGCGSDNTTVETGSEVSLVVEEATEVAEDSETNLEGTTEEATEVVKGTESTETTEKDDKSEDTTKVSTKDTNTEAAKTEGTTTKKDTKPSTTETKKDTSSSTTPTSGSTAPATHEHTWVPVTTTIHHDAVTYQEDQGHYETVVVEEAYDEPEMRVDTICYTCYDRDGSIVTIHGQDENREHALYHANTYGEGNRYGTKEIPTGNTIHHDAVTKQQWVPNIVTVTTKEAYDETVTTGYVCSECGATK